MIRNIVAVGAAVLVAASVSGATQVSPEPIETGMPSPHFGDAGSGAFSAAGVRKRIAPLEPEAPDWARRFYSRSIRVLVALTDPRSGALIAGERDGWDYVWPRDAAAGAIALETAGLHAEARQVVAFLSGLELEGAARFYPDGSRVPGRAAAGDGEGWAATARRAVADGWDRTLPASGPYATEMQQGRAWRDRQDYGENVTGDLIGNAIAAGAPASEIAGRFGTPHGLAREEGGGELDSAAAWAATVFLNPGLRGAVRATLLQLTRDSRRYGIPPIESWTRGEVWTAPTAWSAWALVELGEVRSADRLLDELRRAQTADGTLPERVDAATGIPTSTTPLAWSHAFAILALRARYD